MSYRTFKHLLGETSLERKCRFIFGGGILMLVTLSFYWYGLKTESLVVGQSTEAARALVDPVLMKIHIKDKDLASSANELMGFRPLGETPLFEYHVLTSDAKRKDHQPRDDFERTMLQKFLRSSAGEPDYVKTGEPSFRSFVFRDGTPTYEAQIMPGRRSYKYVQAVFLKPSCLLGCHHSFREGDDGRLVAQKAGDFVGAVVIDLPMERTNKAIHRNRAILISAALVTAILAMVASYVIVRYVIVKPVKHLRDVSDAIAAGKLNIRSQIQTGDEFEELSHAFNRMLHNLVAMQQELRAVNNDLDRKVDELAQANLALYEMNRLKSDFLATMSHELRTPLNSIIGFSEVLGGSEQLSERHRRYASNIMTSGKMLLSMINDILDLAKIESGKMEIRIEDFSLVDICEGLVNLLKNTAEKKNIELTCQVEEAIPLLRQDPGKIKQILYNLLSNAIKFTPESGRVILKALTDGRFAVLEVEDTGIGIPEEDREIIFEKFRQLSLTGQSDGVLTREHQGTGLGLSIVKELTKLLGGDVRLDSQPGIGSKFTIRIPLQLTGNRRYEVMVSDERIDLSKAKRVETRLKSDPMVSMNSLASPSPHLGTSRESGTIRALTRGEPRG